MSPAAARSRFLDVAPPSTAVEIAAGRVAVVLLERASGTPVVRGHAVESLPAGAVVPGLNARNIADVNTVGEALRVCLERSGARDTRAALVVPDAVARVSIVSFETVPESISDLDQLIRWQVRKSVPFPIADAQVSWQRSAGSDFIVTVARRDIVEEYEGVVLRAGLQAGIVDLATFNLINAVSASAPSDWMIVHLTGSDATIGIIREHQLIFFRHKATAEDESLEDLVHQTAMYYEDRLGGGRISRVVVAGLSAAAGVEARRNLEARFGVPVEAVDPRPAASLRDRIGAAPDLLEALAAPIGVLVREVA